VRLRSVPQARSLGIETVYQDLALVDQLSVFHNMFLGKEIRRRPSPLLASGEMKAKARRYLDDMKVDVPSIDVEVGALSGGQRQAIAIARAVYSEVKILLLDEPLAAMGAKEAAQILELIQRLRAKREISMIIISHTYAQLVDVCDRVNLLRHGRIVFDKRLEDTSVEELTELVVSEYRQALRGAGA
jgi:ABC-type sugar transport system ATPase subunit